MEKIMRLACKVLLIICSSGAAIDGKSQLDLPKVERGGLSGAAIAIFVQQGARPPEGFAKAKADAEKKYELIKAIAT